MDYYINFRIDDIFNIAYIERIGRKSKHCLFQNNWDAFDEIDKYLTSQQYFFAFPFMVGEGKDDRGVYCAISGLQYSNTPLGEKDGRVTPRVEQLSMALSKANLDPIISNQILVWLITHYAVAGGLSAGIMNAGGAGTLYKILQL